MELVPYQQPYPPLWYPTHNPESVMCAARHGYHFVTLGGAAHVRELVDMLWHDHDDRTPDGLFNWETSTQHETIIFGSPARVRDQMARRLEVNGCNYVICAFAWGSLPHAQVMNSVRLFADEVMPAFAGRAAPVT